MNPEFNLNYQYKLYLERCGIKREHLLPPDQNREMKRAFFGACGQLLILFRDDISSITDEDKAVEVMEDMVNQVSNFWLAEQNKQN